MTTYTNLDEASPSYAVYWVEDEGEGGISTKLMAEARFLRFAEGDRKKNM
jgi:hypothetical protein